MFRLAEWITEVDNDEDGTCFYLCEECDRNGDTWETVKHAEDCRVGEIQHPQSLPIAHLISAAPDLLAACEDALYLNENILNPTWTQIETGRRLKAAIAKAKGE